jgi:hypothetical protein
MKGGETNAKSNFIHHREFYVDGGVIRVIYEGEGKCQIEIIPTSSWIKSEQGGKILLERKAST